MDNNIELEEHIIDSINSLVKLKSQPYVKMFLTKITGNIIDCSLQPANDRLTELNGTIKDKNTTLSFDGNTLDIGCIPIITTFCRENSKIKILDLSNNNISTPNDDKYLIFINDLTNLLKVSSLDFVLFYNNPIDIYYKSTQFNIEDGYWINDTFIPLIIDSKDEKNRSLCEKILCNSYNNSNTDLNIYQYDKYN